MQRSIWVVVRYCKVFNVERLLHLFQILATTHGISFPAGTEMFHFPAFPPPPYTRSDDGNPAQPRLGSPIRTPSDNNARSPAPRGISQAATSFISS